MKSSFDPKENWEETRKSIEFVPLNSASVKDWERIGFMSGLEVHQQLLTDKKLFCRCPAGCYHSDDDFDGELIRHMRPTLSELGEYDGTALMEFKTKKEITYRINNESACTYDIDDTPPFKINQQALEHALEISLSSNLNIVGEVHITRKQYLDGSIPTGFQRTAILGVEGELELSNKKIRLIQLSIEEDSCREISDVGHSRVYKTDRLGMPLIETVTYPDLFTPYELREAAEYIRFLNRSTGKVRTGMGSGREDVNVSCRGGTRVEIKGVSHNSWIPKLSHIEAFRQYALLRIKELLNKQIPKQDKWNPKVVEIFPQKLTGTYSPVKAARKAGYKFMAVNLPGFHGILSHFTQPGQSFSNEIEDRLKVIACIEKPNMVHSEWFMSEFPDINFDHIIKQLDPKEEDAQILFWGPSEDIKTAIETIEERCRMAFHGVPRETRRPLPDGTTLFERVLPGADRMYPDTDSPPIPLPEEYIEEIRKRIPVPVAIRIKQMRKWKIPSDTYHYLLKNNLVILLERISKDLDYSPKFIGTFLGHQMKFLEGQQTAHPDFRYNQIFELFKFLKENRLEQELAKPILSVLRMHPNMDLNSILTSLKFKRRSLDDLLAPVGFLLEKFKDIRHQNDLTVTCNWLMGQIRTQAIGNIPLSKYSDLVSTHIQTDERKDQEDQNNHNQL